MDSVMDSGKKIAAASLLAAAKADSIPECSHGLWHIKKINLAKNVIAPKDGKLIEVPAGQYTQLWRWTNETVDNWMTTPEGSPHRFPGEPCHADVLLEIANA